MATEEAPRRVGATGPVMAAVLVLVVAGGAAAYLRWPAFTQTSAVDAPQASPLMAAPAVTASTPAPSVPMQTAARVQAQSGPAAQPQAELAPVGRSVDVAAPAAPSFDVVRVAPDGSAVIAGRAQPGAEIVVRDGERELGRALADRRGEFVLIPETKLPAGGRELTLASRESGSSVELRSEDTVVVVVPEAKAATSSAPNSAVALLMPPGGAGPRVLQGASERGGKLGLNTVDYDDKGEIRFSGSAPPATPLRVYVDNQPVGEFKADGHGQWTLTPSNPVAAGLHQFRVDQLSAAGRVTSRIELPFQRTMAIPAEVARERVIVQPGQNLWRIARATYGAGIRYTVIYLANKDTIRDPRLIYPGQVFATPSP